MLPQATLAALHSRSRVDTTRVASAPWVAPTADHHQRPRLREGPRGRDRHDNGRARARPAARSPRHRARTATRRHRGNTAATTRFGMRPGHGSAFLPKRGRAANMSTAGGQLRTAPWIAGRPVESRETDDACEQRRRACAHNHSRAPGSLNHWRRRRRRRFGCCSSAVERVDVEGRGATSTAPNCEVSVVVVSPRQGYVVGLMSTPAGGATMGVIRSCRERVGCAPGGFFGSLAYASEGSV
jgi:hypothetical protein